MNAKFYNLTMELVNGILVNTNELKKALEWELSLDSRDLRSHAWYHGLITRFRAEEIVNEDGGFLVRDCTSQPGNYVLTCRVKNQPLHFVINKVILQPDTVYERVQYQFEDELFDTVPDLITFYVGSGKSITVLSGAKIYYPKNRLYPLSFYASKYALQSESSKSQLENSYHSTDTKCSTQDPKEPPKLPLRKNRSNSLQFRDVEKTARGKYNTMDYKKHSETAEHFSHFPSSYTGSLNRSLHLPRHFVVSSVDKDTESDLLASSLSIIDNRSSENDILGYQGNIGTETFSHLQRMNSLQNSGSDSGNGSGDSAFSFITGDPAENPKISGVVIRNPNYIFAGSGELHPASRFFNTTEVEDKLMEKNANETFPSCFDVENYQTLLLPFKENKPLDGQALRDVRTIIKENCSRVLAYHLTKMDLEIIFKNTDDKIKYCNGMELCSLPHGRQLRLDLIERTECLKFFVATTILTCANDNERTETLYKWIETALDTKTALGNLYGFCGIMMGLCLPQIEGLHKTWHALRQKHTETAFNFESKLRPSLRNMNSCTNPHAPNTTVPHLLPFLSLIERDAAEFEEKSPKNPSIGDCSTFWANGSHDFGLPAIQRHLQHFRKCVRDRAGFEKNANRVLQEARIDDITLNVFQTEFQLKLLWGSRGALSGREDRYSKFDQMLTLMAEKLSNLNDDV